MTIENCATPPSVSAFTTQKITEQLQKVKPTNGRRNRRGLTWLLHWGGDLNGGRYTLVGTNGSTMIPWCRISLGFDVEVFSDNPGTQFRIKIVVPDHDIAVVHVNCNRNNFLVHNIPLLIFIFSFGTVPEFKLNSEKATYSCHKVLIELSPDQSAKNSFTFD